MVVPSPHGRTISHSLLVESCYFPLCYMCTTFYLEADPYALKMEAVRFLEMPVRFHQCIHYVPEDNSLRIEAVRTLYYFKTYSSV
jgi:hypothetical protein